MVDSSLKLIRPDQAFTGSFLAMCDDFIQVHGDDHHGSRYRDLRRSIDKNGIEAYIQQCRDWEQGINLPDGFVPDSMFWLIRDDVEVVGRAMLRHRLTEALRRIGGHIGYEIKPSCRRRGYGTAILALMLDEARAFGLERVMITCDPDNTGSRRIIEKNGGELIGTIRLEDQGRSSSRYWIDLTN